MQSGYFKLLLPLTAVALLILACLATEGETIDTIDTTDTTDTIDGDNPCETNSSAEEVAMTATPEITPERIHEVRLKYDDLFWRQPNVHGVGEGLLRNQNGDLTETWGIIISVTKKVDQSTLPAEDRIPDCLEGVPVQVIEEGGWRLLSDPPEEPNGYN